MNWSVVATVKADKELIDIFIDHYIKIGASEIFIYLDDPNDKYIQDAYSGSPLVKIHVCDEAFWSIDYKFKNLKFVGRPDGVEDRQSHNVIHALSKTQAKWLACVDIDEIIYSERWISSVLNTIPDNIFSIRLKPFEAIYLNEAPKTYSDVFKTKYFKHLTKREDVFFWNNVYLKEYIHKAGFFGHVTGKCFFRTDEPLKWPGLHNFNPIDITLKTNFIVDDLKLLHFEALTPSYFVTKTINRLNKTFNIKYLDGPSANRLKNLKKIYDENNEIGLLGAYNDMHVIDQEVLDKAINLQVIEEIDTNVIDKFSYKTLMTTHRTLPAYNKEKDICELIDSDGGIEEHLSVVQIEYDYTQDLCYLYTIVDNKPIYLYLNKDGRLVSYPFKKAMLLKFTCIDKLNLSCNIQYANGQYLTARLDKQFTLGPKEAKDWELFSIKRI